MATVLMCFTLNTNAQINRNLRGKGLKDVKINKDKSKSESSSSSRSSSSNNDVVKTMAGKLLTGSAAYYYKSYSKYVSEANEYIAQKKWSTALSRTESAGIAISKVQQKSDKELDLSLEEQEVEKLKLIAGGNESEAKTSIKEDRAKRDSEAKNKESIRKEINAKYDPMKYELRKVKRFLRASSSDGFTDFIKGLTYLNENNLTVSNTMQMVNNPDELAKTKDIGSASSRDEIRDDILPGVNNALEKNGVGDYSLKRLDSKLSDMGDYAHLAKLGGANSAENAKKVQTIYDGIVLFKKFVNDHEAMNSYFKKADYYHKSVKETLDKLYDKYRAGDFHRAKGSGIYLVQKDGITAQTLSESVVTDKIIIDGKKPVHIFVLTDKNLGSYSSFLQFDFVDGDKDPNQNKYVFDARKAVPLYGEEKNIGYKKLVFIPSSEWNDLQETYVKSMFYDCGTQSKLADVLMPGVPQEFTIYSADNSLKKKITIEATEEGLAFLKGMKAKMEKYEIDASRMEKAEVSNPALEKSVASGFIANSKGVVKEVVKVVITSKPWYVKKNALGVTLYKDFYAHVAFKKADGNYYTQKVRCKKEFVGGSFGAMKVYGSGGSRRIRKENINK